MPEKLPPLHYDLKKVRRAPRQEFRPRPVRPQAPEPVAAEPSRQAVEVRPLPFEDDLA
jgi:hypothetical protein